MKCFSSYTWIAYLLSLLLGGIASYNLINLNETKQQNPSINISVPSPVVIHDTVTIESVKWKTIIKKVHCCHEFEVEKDEKKKNNQDFNTKEDTIATCTEMPQTEG